MKWRLLSSQRVPITVHTSRGLGIVDKAASWVRAEASLAIEGPLPDAAYEARIAVCRTCDQLDPRDAPQVGFCKACGCGGNARAELTVKGRMPAATCPKNIWPSKHAA